MISLKLSLFMSRLLELLLLFVGIPLAMMAFFPIKGLFAYLCMVALLCAYVLLRDPEFENKELWHAEKLTLQNIRPVLIRFFAFVVLSIIVVQAWRPDLLYNFPRERTLIWAMVMVLYPILSVYPQEVIFRSFFMHRYRVFFGSGMRMQIINGLFFGFAHIFLLNFIAPGLCAAGGMMFARTYQKHRSLALVALEHSLYGCWVFTLGLGYYFYSGAHR